MAISSIECFQVRWPGQNVYAGKSGWVRIQDDRGQTGYGEISPMDGGLVTLMFIREHLREMLIGTNPFDAAVLQERMLHRFMKHGPDGILSSALAGIDIALWDLKGKLANQPIYRLLGGGWRTRLPFYASVGGPNATRSLGEVMAEVERRLADRPSLVKLRLEPDRTRRDADVDGDIAKARALRKLVGDGFPLVLDGNNGYSFGAAIRVGRVLEELGYSWFEEPLQHYHVQATGDLAQRLDIPVSAGEQTYTVAGFTALIAAGVRILQPDIIKMGGFTGLQQVQALAQAHGCDVIPHQTQPTIGNTANLHFVASQLHGWAPCEVNDTSGRQHAVFRSLPTLADGCFELTEAPGLGIDIDEAALAARMQKLPGD